MRDIRSSIIMTGLCLCLATGAVMAENKPAAADKPANGTANATQTAQPVSPPDPQLTDAQKQKLHAWRELQRQYMLNTMNNQEIIEDLAAADPYDPQKISATASKMGEEMKKYYEQYAQKNREFLDSLTPEQKVKIGEMRKQRKTAMQQRKEQLLQSR